MSENTIIFNMIDDDANSEDASVSIAGAKAIASLLRSAVTAQHENMHGPVVADVMRVVSRLETLLED